MENIVEMKGIEKIYPNGVIANESVDFSIAKGEIHALVGENGAGKTTLMKMLFGIEEPTEGTIILHGQEVHIKSVSQALHLGLGMVQQHFMLVPSMTVTENILLGAEPSRGFLLDRREADRITEELAAKYSFDIDVHTRIEDLPVGDRQKVEILKVLYRKARVIILDEPTAVLTPQETEELFRQLIVLKEHGHSIVFISHKLREIEQICDRVTIMRKGRTVGTYSMREITTEKISEYMMGKEVHLCIEKKQMQPGDVCLRIENLSYMNDENKKMLDGISFALRSGEILGLVGVEGNGQKELVDIISGASKPLSGAVYMNGCSTEGKNIEQIRNMSFAHIPQERMTTGSALNCSVTENLVSVVYRDKSFRKGPLLNWKKLAKITRDKITEYKIKTDSEATPVKMLSGGNIQKVVVARELMNAPKIVVADQPTRGIDVGAANLIHNKLAELRSAGSGVLLISSDLTEVLSLADSILVIYNGKISAYFPDAGVLQEADLGFYMLGVKCQTDEEIRGCRHA